MLRPIKVRHHLAFMQSRGFAAREVLGGTQIDASRLDDPDYLVSAEQCHAVVSNIIRLTGDSGIGLRAGTETSIADLGVVGYAMASSETLGQAIGLWAKYGSSPVGGPFAMEVIPPDHAGTWGTIAQPNGTGGSVYRYYVEETYAMGITFGRYLTGRSFKVKHACFAYPAPKHWKEYKAVFRSPLEFDAGQTCALVVSPTLDTPLRGSDHELREMCIRQCSLLVRQIERRGPVSSRLRMLFRAHGRVTDLDGAAEALNMSPRSMRRHLQAEGVTFQRILDEFRKDLADEYLRSGAMSAREIAHLLGFSNGDSFRKAYKSWGSTHDVA